MTQYEKELEQVIKNGEDVQKFKEEWHTRACAAYRQLSGSKEDINNFRCGNIKI